MEEAMNTNVTPETGYMQVELQDFTIGSYSKNEAYKALRTNLMFCGNDKKVIVFTSCHPAEGKTTTVMHLARTLTEIGKSVLVIDGDMRRSVVAARYGITGVQCGLSQYLSGQVEKKDIICETQFAGFHIVFAGFYPPNPVELLDSERFRSFVAEVREEYDYVLIDNPPVVDIVDAIVTAKCCDGAILVVAKGTDSIRQVKTCKQQIERTGCAILGVVLNSPTHRKHYAHNRQNYYGNKYYTRTE
jgi:capsular exopolysaccharide synthesis family protein